MLSVGAGEAFATLAAAVGASAAGDTILVDAGTYTDDFTTIAHALTIDSVGGMASFVADVAPPNGKAIMTVDADLSINGLGFSGAAVGDGNGAGIRYEAGNLVIDNAWFHDNQDGLLAAADPAGSITILNSEFSDNGTTSGFTHNLYVNQVGTLTIDGSYFHDVNTGHEIKSRALNTIILDNRIQDGPNLSASYSIDLPNGGDATISGNVIEKGPLAQNWTYVSYGEEGQSNPGTTLAITGNTIVNDMTAGQPHVVGNTPQDGQVAVIAGNTLYGITPAGLSDGSGTVNAQGNTFLALPGPVLDTSHPFAAPEPASAAVLVVPVLAVLVLARRGWAVSRRGASRPAGAR